ncbi:MULTISPECIES: spermidine/putrescine ABC transporter substrate-binding protein [Spirulina sp. CCY15215]|uniref:ABC transporter substrate-binding protein n=1 Tax=Spirulina sp. CCY15215 TaxID=2767591 RepID=UPI001EF25E7C|nr:spermidine/putrescine ABC transporter substrate-binding protein [Spirulina major]
MMRIMQRRQFLTKSGISLLNLFLSGCGWTLANIQAAATNPNLSNELYIYTWTAFVDEKLLQQFTKETGIHSIANIFDSNETMLARFQVSGGGGYSILYPSDYMVKKMIDLGFLLELDKSKILVEDRLFPRFKNPEYDPESRYSIPIAWGLTGLIYNRNQVKKPPEDWDYLWQHQQEFAKRITLLNDVREVMGAALKSLGYSYNSSNPKEIKAAYEKLRCLKSAIATFTTEDWKTQILTGDIAIAMCYSDEANRIIRENEDLAFVIPRSGTSFAVDNLVIPKTAPNIAGGYAWLNFILQPQVLAKLCQRLSFGTPSEAAFNLLPLQFQKNPILFPSQNILMLCEEISPLDNETNELIDRYWTLLTSN